MRRRRSPQNFFPSGLSEPHFAQRISRKTPSQAWLNPRNLRIPDVMFPLLSQQSPWPASPPVFQPLAIADDVFYIDELRGITGLIVVGC